MTRHFTRACTANGYAAMGNSLRRPRSGGARKLRGDIKSAIEAERVKEARMAKVNMRARKK